MENTVKVMNDGAPKKKLLLIEHDSSWLRHLQQCLHSHGFQAEGHVRGDVLPKLLEREQHRFDLVMLDIEQPSHEGFYWLKWLRQYHSRIPVIVTSVHSGERERLSGLEHGARDYVLKPFHERELLFRVSNILGDRKSVTDSYDYLRIGAVRVDTEKQCAIREGQRVSLTQQELKIIKLLYLNVGKTVSREEITVQTRGVCFNPMDRSVDIHINKLRNKLETNPAEPVYIRTVRGKGYTLQLP